MATWISRPTWRRLWSLTRLLPPCLYLSYLSEVIPSLVTSAAEEVASLRTQPALTSHRFVYSFRHAPNLALFVKRNNPLPGFWKVSNNTCVSGWLPRIIYMAQISPVLLIRLMCPTDIRGQNDGDCWFKHEKINHQPCICSCLPVSSDHIKWCQSTLSSTHLILSAIF